MKCTKTLQVQVRDSHCAQLNRMARSVNFCWNYINALSYRSIKEQGAFLSDYDLQKYTQGANKELGLHSQSVQEISKEYVIRRRQFKKSRLSWRKSHGIRRSLGWVPVKSGAATWKNGQVYHNGTYYRVWDSYGLSQYKFRSSNFSEDSRGRWYFNVVVESEVQTSAGTAAVGIDLGCKAAATDSNGFMVTGREYRKLEAQLGVAQRARKKKRAKAIHAKIRNRRKDSLHKYSRTLVNNNAAIFVGNVSSKALVKTNLAKSALDAGWGQLKTMLSYKCAHAGVVFEVLNESNTTQTCSSCGSLPESRPRGIAGLGIREWTCSECGVAHDRDINAARNILALGLQRLAEGKVAA
ncbi:MAG: putative transposase [Motiliproteus sp.]|jgi:putative transposase